MQQMKASADDLIDHLGLTWQNLEAIGLGIAAQLVEKGKVVAVAPNLGWRDLLLQDMLLKTFERPVRIVNDLSAIAWAESLIGAGRGADNLLCVFIGSGIGSGIIINKQLVEGAQGVAGEIGHVKVRAGGLKCGCGEAGCLEAYAGGVNVAARARRAVAAGEAPILASQVALADRLAFVDVELAAQAGDRAAKDIWEDAARALGFVLSGAVTLLNPEVFILGGGVMDTCPRLKARIKEDINNMGSAVSTGNLVISDAHIGDHAGAIGAAALAQAYYKKTE